MFIWCQENYVSIEILIVFNLILKVFVYSAKVNMHLAMVNA